MHLRDPVPPLPAAVPADLAVVVNRALAKDPAERYADGNAFALALRRAEAAPDTGELAAAPVPVDSPEATQVLTGVAPALAAASATDAAAGVRPRLRRVDPRIDRHGVAGVPWPLVAIIGLAVVLVLALLLTHSGSPSTPTAGPTAGPSSTTTPSTAPVKASAPRIVAASYVGRQAAQVKDALKQLGFTDVSTTTQSNPGGHAAGTVAAVTPSGQVATTTPVQLTVWGAQQTAPKPAPKPAPTHHKHGKGKGHK
jgi:serine/threonine-protein kinase